MEPNAKISKTDTSKLLDANNDIIIVGKCANCGVEFHIHKPVEFEWIKLDDKIPDSPGIYKVRTIDGKETEYKYT